MARINPVPEQDLPEEVKLALQGARSRLTQFTGRELERGIEPMELSAHVPGLFAAMSAFGQASVYLTGIDERTRALAQLKAATMTQCEYCIDVGSLIARQWGLTDEELLALPNYRVSPLFSEVDKLVLDYAVGMSRTPVDVPDELFEALKKHFDDAQLVELTHVIARENMAGRFNVALGVGAAGFSEGMVCAVPVGVP
ncbi:MAG: carboxymuconolactone decarboxylase family protein [Chloroflexota bacterium]